MIGFLNGTLKHTFQPKPRNPFTGKRRIIIREPQVFCRGKTVENEFEAIAKDKRELNQIKQMKQLSRSFKVNIPIDIRDFEEFKCDFTDFTADTE